MDLAFKLWGVVFQVTVLGLPFWLLCVPCFPLLLPLLFPFCWPLLWMTTTLLGSYIASKRFNILKPRFTCVFSTATIPLSIQIALWCIWSMCAYWKLWKHLRTSLSWALIFRVRALSFSFWAEVPGRRLTSLIWVWEVTVCPGSLSLSLTKLLFVNHSSCSGFGERLTS